MSRRLPVAHGDVRVKRFTKQHISIVGPGHSRGASDVLRYGANVAGYSPWVTPRLPADGAVC